MHDNQKTDLNALPMLLGRVWSVLDDDQEEVSDDPFGAGEECETWSFSAGILASTEDGRPRIFTGAHRLVCPAEINQPFLVLAPGIEEQQILETVSGEGHLTTAIEEARRAAARARAHRPDWLVATCPLGFDRLMQRALRQFTRVFAHIAYSIDPEILIPIHGFDVVPTLRFEGRSRSLAEKPEKRRPDA